MVAMVGGGRESKKLTETRRLGKELLESRAHVNNAPLLIATLASSLSADSHSASPKALTEALTSLEAFFIPLVQSGEFTPAAQRKADEELQKAKKDEEKTEESEMAKAEAIYRKWIWDRYREFVDTMLRFVARHSAIPTVQTAALHTIMELVRAETDGEFNNQLYSKLCSTIVCSRGLNADLLAVLVSDYFKYLDVCYHTYSNMEKIAIRRVAKKSTGNDLISSDDEDGSNSGVTSVHGMVRNIYDVLMNLPTFPYEGDVTSEELWCNNLSMEDTAPASGVKRGAEPSQHYSKKKQRVRFSKAWLTFLQLPLPVDIYKKVLPQLHKRVIPFLTNPNLLSDFLTNSFNVGGLISVMALNGLFILIMSFNLEYPDYYKKLYSLLEPSIFVAKHRARFFELLDKSLESPAIPSYLAAAFAKKLGRLALSSPPAGAIVVIAVIHNLLRRHPTINSLVHRDMGNSTLPGVEDQIQADNRGADPFLFSEEDPAKCKALQSSLWEVETLRSHYCPAISRFVSSLETDLTVRAKTTEVAITDFSSASYTTIFTEEVSKRLKAVPLAFYQTVPTTLFSENGLDDFLGWRFGDQKASVAAVPVKNDQPSIVATDGQDSKLGGPITSEGASSSSSDEDSEAKIVQLPKKRRK